MKALTASYYIKLSCVVDTLVNTFKENRDALASEKILQAKDPFYMPMLTIAELKNTLDAEIEKINVPGLMDAFMRRLLEHEDAWLDEDENKITQLVSGFFVGTAFSDFSSRTITSLLMDKYGITDNAQLAEKIYNDWMKKLTAKASPLFCFNRSVWCEEQTGKQAIISIPMYSAPIKAAADHMSAIDPVWSVKDSAPAGGISAVTALAGFPICAEGHIPEMHDRHVHSTSEAGRYSYEGAENFGMTFNDWRKLPPLDPCSFWNSAR